MKPILSLLLAALFLLLFSVSVFADALPPDPDAPWVRPDQPSSFPTVWIVVIVIAVLALAAAILIYVIRKKRGNRRK